MITPDTTPLIKQAKDLRPGDQVMREGGNFETVATVRTNAHRTATHVRYTDYHLWIFDPKAPLLVIPALRARPEPEPTPEAEPTGDLDARIRTAELMVRMCRSSTLDHKHWNRELDEQWWDGYLTALQGVRDFPLGSEISQEVSGQPNPPG